tara:strand:+ start:3391 stop:4035 length:645 start_codon:yes stop_codon:yes gene_type:complete
MDEDLSIINSNTRLEKIKTFLINNKKSLILLLITIIFILSGFFGYGEFRNSKVKQISNQYNSAVNDYSSNNKEKTTGELVEIVKEQNPTYSPLALYFIIDNNLITDIDKVNKLFDELIYETSLDKEIRNLIIYKKGLYNADQSDESELLEILKPLINSKSIWSSHALYLIAEFFYSKNEKQKAKDFFLKIIELENSNQDIIRETQKRLKRDLSD